MKIAQEWAARIEGDRTTPWVEMVKMIQDDALNGIDIVIDDQKVGEITGVGVLHPGEIDRSVNCPPWCDTCQAFHRPGEFRTCKEEL